jgi:hypothetical protein
MSKDKTPEEMAEDHANMRCPEQGPEFIVWCMCKDDFLTGYQAAAPQWISVKDRLPELKETLLDLWNESDVVLIVVKPMETTPQFATQARLRSCPRSYWEPGFWAACKIDSHNEWETDEWTLQQVTHWMPLPEPPKEYVNHYEEEPPVEKKKEEE